ncbi:unnamed protein product [Psylliodes chrysocephalus]|uniref:Cyclin-like domain-containing protein n=1 Tax=Psylliodes chrysocephalus TaxID=3402493 RepID=A0A9P0CGH3_9CUCU|nr:unnamed protein product [Psylliodes chrysocephala]
MRICTLPSLIRNFSAVKMSSREESKEINKNNFKNAKVKRPLGDLKLNIIHSDVPPGSSKNEICKNEMKSIIKLPNKRPRSANSIGQVEKFNFDILEDKNNENTLKTKKIEGAIKKIGKVNIIHSDVPPGSSKNETDSNEKDKTFKNNLKYLCKKEMKSIIKLPNKRPQSANSIGQVEKFTFDILEDKNNENTLETKKIEGANKKIGKVSVIDKENKPKNVILMENACTERRLIRQRSELEDTVCYRQRLRSEGSLTKSVVDYKPFKVACRKPIRAPVMDNIVRIHTRRVSPIRPNPLSSESVLISKVIGTPMLPRCDVSVIDKENKPKNVILMENACTERRLIRQRSELEDMVCYRQKLRSEGSLTKSVVDYKPFNDACRKPIRAPVMDNIVRIHTRRVSPIRPNPLSSESVLISKVIGTPMSPRCDVSVIDKENKPKNVILMENACTERRLIRQRSELEDMVCYRQKLRSEGSLTKSAVDYKPFNVACRKPIRAPFMDNIVRIHTRRVSPIRPNPLSSESVLISKVIGTPMSPRCDEYFPSCDCEFTKDMLQEIIEVGKIQEKKILLSKHFLNLFGHDANDRSKIVNWMLWEQQNCMFLDSDLYIAVSLLDQVLARIAVPRNMYQLVAMACIRLSNKLGEDDIWSPDLLKTPDNIFAETQLSKMEWKLFKLLDFSVHTIEPSVYVNAYLKLANLDPESGKYFKILFCLDHALHESSYSSTPTSLVALAAMSVASKTFKTPDLEKIIKDLKDGLKADEVTLCSTMEKLIVGHIHRLNLSKDSFDILMKYRNCAWNQENQ